MRDLLLRIKNSTFIAAFMLASIIILCDDYVIADQEGMTASWLKWKKGASWNEIDHVELIYEVVTFRDRPVFGAKMEAYFKGENVTIWTTNTLSNPSKGNIHELVKLLKKKQVRLRSTPLDEDANLALISYPSDIRIDIKSAFKEALES